LSVEDVEDQTLGALVTRSLLNP